MSPFLVKCNLHGFVLVFLTAFCAIFQANSGVPTKELETSTNVESIISSNSQCSILLEFHDKGNKDIENASFFFYIKEERRFKGSLSCDQRVPTVSSFRLKMLPKEWTMGIVSSNGFYHHFWDSDDLKLTNGINRIYVPISGIISVSLPNYLPDIPMSIFLSYYKKNTQGTYLYEGCIFIGHHIEGTGIQIPGLETGEYMIEIGDLEKDLILWRRRGIDVTAGEQTCIKDIILSCKTNEEQEQPSVHMKLEEIPFCDRIQKHIISCILTGSPAKAYAALMSIGNQSIRNRIIRNIRDVFNPEMMGARLNQYAARIDAGKGFLHNRDQIQAEIETYEYKLIPQQRARLAKAKREYQQESDKGSDRNSIEVLEKSVVLQESILQVYENRLKELLEILRSGGEKL